MNFLEALEKNETCRVKIKGVNSSVYEVGHMRPRGGWSFFEVTAEWETAEPKTIIREVLMGKKPDGAIYIHENRDYFDIQKFLPVGDTSCKITIEVLS